MTDKLSKRVSEIKINRDFFNHMKIKAKVFHENGILKIVNTKYAHVLYRDSPISWRSRTILADRTKSYFRYASESEI